MIFCQQFKKKNSVYIHTVETDVWWREGGRNKVGAGESTERTRLELHIQMILPCVYLVLQMSG